MYLTVCNMKAKANKNYDEHCDLIYLLKMVIISLR